MFVSGFTVLNTVFGVCVLTESSQHSVLGCCQKHCFTGQWRCVRKPSFGTGCICCLLPTFGCPMAFGQRLLFPAHSRPWRVSNHAAARPVIADIRRGCKTLHGRTHTMRTKLQFAMATRMTAPSALQTRTPFAIECLQWLDPNTAIPTRKGCDIRF